jgi:hypothetical protein
MCVPELMSKARSIGKARQEMSVEGVNLNNLKDAPRQLALTTRAQFKPLPGISLNRIADTTRQSTYG